MKEAYEGRTGEEGRKEREKGRRKEREEGMKNTYEGRKFRKE